MVGWHHRLHSSLTWIWANAGRWWRTEESGVLQSMGSQGVRHDLVTEQLWEPASWFIDGHLLTVPSHARGEEALWGLCYKGINPIHQGSTLRISSPPNATTLPASNAATLRVRFSTNELQGDVNIQPITVLILVRLACWSSSLAVVVSRDIPCGHIHLRVNQTWADLHVYHVFCI